VKIPPARLCEGRLSGERAVVTRGEYQGGDYVKGLHLLSFIWGSSQEMISGGKMVWEGTQTAPPEMPTVRPRGGWRKRRSSPELYSQRPSTEGLHKSSHVRDTVGMPAGSAPRGLYHFSVGDLPVGQI